MSLWSNFNRTSSSSRDRRFNNDDYHDDKDFFNFSRSLFNTFSLFDDLEKRHRQLFNDPFFTGADVWLIDDDDNHKRLEQSSQQQTKNDSNNKENQLSNENNQKNGTITVRNNNPHHHHRIGNNWLTNPLSVFSQLSNRSNQLVPSNISIDISESNDNYAINASLPGIEKENVKVECDTNRSGQHYLTISAERKSDIKKEDKDKKYIYSETSFGSVSRSIPLPDDVDMEKGVTAKMENGQLKLNVPRTQQKKQSPKQIKIQ